VPQTHEEVLEWAEPETGGPATLSVGELSIMTHLPLAAALPPPAPPEDFDLLGQVGSQNRISYAGCNRLTHALAIRFLMYLTAQQAC
jgi:hypothetical protein